VSHRSARSLQSETGPQSLIKQTDPAAVED
jgi:hypothetical protein